jgi:Ser/Thr protein kinase RdoA (MazF antagonist)
MPLFDQTIEVSSNEVAQIVAANWNLQLGKIIKASQNHTFEAVEQSTGIKFVVRVTPDPEVKYQQRVEKELIFVNYCVASNKIQHICAPIKNIHGNYLIRSGDLLIIVSEWAKGAPLDFMSYRWMTDRNIVIAWGKWLAELHQVSKQFSVDHPETATTVQRWDQVHSCILEGSEIHSDDIAVMKDPEHYGVLHGDLNVSNLFFVDETQTLSVYDWDQTQQGWYLFDVAQSELAVYMLNEAGSLVDGSVVSEANPVQFEEWMVEGYESVAGVGSVDRARLTRMVNLRKHFYEKFCRTAVAQGDLPKDMEYFVKYVVGWFDKLKTKDGSNVKV